MSPELAESPVRPDERLLGEVVGQRRVSVEQVAEKPPHRGLMTRHQLSEG